MRQWIQFCVIAILTAVLPIQASAHMLFTSSDVQIGLRQNIERTYYTFKDQPIKNPQHKVSDVKVLHYIQHDQIAILVGSCLVDGKENLITGSLWKDPKTGKMQFGGGWMERNHIHTPLFYGMGEMDDGLVISGIVLDKSITHVRVCSADQVNQFSVIYVNSEGYFARWVPIKRQAVVRRASPIWLEGLDKNGKVIYSPRKPQTSENETIGAEMP